MNELTIVTVENGFIVVFYDAKDLVSKAFAFETPESLSIQILTWAREEYEKQASEDGKQATEDEN